MGGKPTYEVNNGKALMDLSDIGTVLSFSGIFWCD
jgi:hypothetical protein